MQQDLFLDTIRIPLSGHRAKCRFALSLQRHPEMGSQKRLATDQELQGQKLDLKVQKGYF